jgi:hypothetical protein
LLLTISLTQFQNRKTTLHINLFTPSSLERPYAKSSNLCFTALLDKLRNIFSVGHIDPLLHSHHPVAAGRSTSGVDLHMDEKNEQFLRPKAVIVKTGKPKRLFIATSTLAHFQRLKRSAPERLPGACREYCAGCRHPVPTRTTEATPTRQLRALPGLPARWRSPLKPARPCRDRKLARRSYLLAPGGLRIGLTFSIRRRLTSGSLINRERDGRNCYSGGEAPPPPKKRK